MEVSFNKPFLSMRQQLNPTMLTLWMLAHRPLYLPQLYSTLNTSQNLEQTDLTLFLERISTAAFLLFNS
nr:hypothetical transcript [Hymenolepis microstoma]